jgi:hypothetical protein
MLYAETYPSSRSNVAVVTEIFAYFTNVPLISQIL